MLWFGLSLLCAGVAVAYWMHLCLLWSAAIREGEAAAAAAAAAAEEEEAEKGGERGLTAEELGRLEEGKMAVGGKRECAVCLEEMEEGQAARVLPSCGHAFHRACADPWLQAHAVCPLCRARLHPPPLPPSQPQPQPQPQSPS